MFQLLVNRVVKDFKGQVEMESLEGHGMGLMTLPIETFQNLYFEICVFMHFWPAEENPFSSPW